MKILRWISASGAVAVILAAVFFTSTFHSLAQFHPWVGRAVPTNSFLRDGAFTDISSARQAISNLLTLPAPSQSVSGLTQVVTARTPYGTYWSLQGLGGAGAAPLPGSPFGTNVPIYALGSNHFVFDDRSVNYAALAEASRLEALTNGWSESAGQNTPGFDAATALWLEIPSDGLAVSNQLKVIVHNTVPGQPYTILTKAALNDPTWSEEQLVFGDEGHSPLVSWRETRGRTFLSGRGQARPLVYSSFHSRWIRLLWRVTR